MPFQSSRFGPEDAPGFVRVLGWSAILGCAIFGVSILIADFVVPGHDWVADTISDLAAGRHEFIVDIGIYAFSASNVAVALLAAHLHPGGARWSAGTIALAAMGLIVFLIGARDEYGDLDSEGVAIHIYLVYAIGALMAAIPWCMAEGAGRMHSGYGRLLITTSVVWIASAPVFFFLPTDVDGLYERCLGLISAVLLFTLVRLFFRISGQPAAAQGGRSAGQGNSG